MLREIDFVQSICRLIRLLVTFVDTAVTWLQVETRRAESELAYDLQAAKSKQAIKEAEMQIAVEERGKQIQVQDQEILRKEKELESTVKKPAEAEKYRLETLALAERNKIILEAEAQAIGIKVKGDAEAFAVEAKAKAEALQMAKKAEAWKHYGEAAVVDMVLNILPKVAAEVANPLSSVKSVTVVASGDGDIGPARLTSEVLDIVAKIPKAIEALTGVNMSRALGARRREPSLWLLLAALYYHSEMLCWYPSVFWWYCIFSMHF